MPYGYPNILAFFDVGVPDAASKVEGNGFWSGNEIESLRIGTLKRYVARNHRSPGIAQLEQESEF